MSDHDSRYTRTPSTSTGMQVHVHPMPFDPATGYTIAVTGGIPPYTFEPEPSPPNPPGVEVEVSGEEAHVTVPPGTPPGTQVFVNVSDSSQPPQQAPGNNVTQ